MSTERMEGAVSWGGGEGGGMWDMEGILMLWYFSFNYNVKNCRENGAFII